MNLTALTPAITSVANTKFCSIGVGAAPLTKLSVCYTSPSSARKLKVLISAYACEPGRGSEPGVGWNTAREVAQQHQVWVLTSQTHRREIEAELRQRPIPNLKIIYLDPLGWIYDWSQEGRRPHWDVHLHSYLWQIRAYFVARQLHQQINFDLAHHVTYVKYSTPSLISLLPLPFLWGPVGGGESSPPGFWAELSLRAKLYETLRIWARRLGELDPLVRLTARRSDLIWATTAETAQRLLALGGHVQAANVQAANVQVVSQVGLNQAELAALTSYASTDPPPVRFISIGRLLHWKGFHLGLQAFAEADLPASAEYWIVGEGPEQAALQHLTQQLGIAHQVKFWHKLPRTETLQQLGNCLALVHPSLHDSGGLVCLEAMAAGCPVICLDLGGPAVQVTAQTGFKIAAHSPKQAVQDLAAAMTQLAANPELHSQLAQAGQQRAREFSWSKKAEQLSQIYQAMVDAAEAREPGWSGALNHSAKNNAKNNAGRNAGL
jgi:glycosyltransferase involved in cell wall biosynthesis